MKNTIYYYIVGIYSLGLALPGLPQGWAFFDEPLFNPIYFNTGAKPKLNTKQDREFHRSRKEFVMQHSQLKGKDHEWGEKSCWNVYGKFYTCWTLIKDKFEALDSKKMARPLALGLQSRIPDLLEVKPVGNSKSLMTKDPTFINVVNSALYMELRANKEDKKIFNPEAFTPEKLGGNGCALDPKKTDTAKLKGILRMVGIAQPGRQGSNFEQLFQSLSLSANRDDANKGREEICQLATNDSCQILSDDIKAKCDGVPVAAPAAAPAALAPGLQSADGAITNPASTPGV